MFTCSGERVLRCLRRTRLMIIAVDSGDRYVGAVPIAGRNHTRASEHRMIAACIQIGELTSLPPSWAQLGVRHHK